MEKSFFWAFFMIALVVGTALGFSVNNLVITGKLNQGWRIFDSDNGVNVEIQGFCQATNGNFVDSCLNEDTLIEYQLNFNNQCSQVHINCEILGYEGCENGICYNYLASD
jgi:hypothetical protein